MVLDSLVLALGLGLHPGNAMASHPPASLVITGDQEKRSIENSTSMYNSGCEIYQFHGANDTAVNCIMTAFDWYPEKKEPKAWKEKAIEVILKNAEGTKDPLTKISRLIRLCSYGLKGCKDGWVPAEILSREHPDLKMRAEYAILAQELRKSYSGTVRLSRTTTAS